MGASDPTTAAVSQLGGGAGGGVLLAANSEHCREVMRLPAEQICEFLNPKGVLWGLASLL